MFREGSSSDVAAFQGTLHLNTMQNKNEIIHILAATVLKCSVEIEVSNVDSVCNELLKEMARFD